MFCQLTNENNQAFPGSTSMILLDFPLRPSDRYSFWAILFCLSKPSGEAVCKARPILVAYSITRDPETPLYIYWNFSLKTALSLSCRQVWLQRLSFLQGIILEILATFISSILFVEQITTHSDVWKMEGAENWEQVCGNQRECL